MFKGFIFRMLPCYVLPECRHISNLTPTRSGSRVMNVMTAPRLGFLIGLIVGRRPHPAWGIKHSSRRCMIFSSLPQAPHFNHDRLPFLWGKGKCQMNVSTPACFSLVGGPIPGLQLAFLCGLTLLQRRGVTNLGWFYQTQYEFSCWHVCVCLQTQSMIMIF